MHELVEIVVDDYREAYPEAAAVLSQTAEGIRIEEARFFTTLDPDEMTRDPIFSFNPELPDIDPNRAAEMIGDPTRGACPSWAWLGEGRHEPESREARFEVT